MGVFNGILLPRSVILNFIRKYPHGGMDNGQATMIGKLIIIINVNFLFTEVMAFKTF